MMQTRTLFNFLMAILFSSQIKAQSYYVSVSGNDANAGTFAAPWRTIQKAATAVTSGTVFIMQGVYHEKITMKHSGTSGNSILFRNYNQDSVMLDGTGGNNAAMLSVINKSYITLRGIIIQNFVKNNAVGILIQGNCSYITITNCIIHDISWTNKWNAVPNSDKNSQPLIVYGNNATLPVNHLVIDSNIIYHNITGFSESCTVDGNVDTFEIRFNKVYNNRNIGILMAGNYHVSNDPNTDHARNGVCSDNLVYGNVSNYAANGGIYVDGGWNNIIERNTLFDNVYGIEIGCEKNPNGNGTAQSIIVRDNLIYNNTATGIEFGGYNYPQTGTVINCSFLNNTCYNNDTGDSIGAEMDISYAVNCTVKNNIFYALPGKTLYAIGVDSSLHNHFDYNTWYNNKGAAKAKFIINGTTYKGFSVYQSSTGEDAHSVYANPQFMNAPVDFHLQSTSPCIDAGDPSFIAGDGETDLDNLNRIHNSRVDAGCYEYGSAMKLEFNSSTRELELFPNPARSSFIISGWSEENFYLSIFDLTGRIIFYRQISAGTTAPQIDCSNWTKGIYLMQAEQEGIILRKKILIE